MKHLPVIILAVICALSLGLNGALILRGNYINKLLIKLGVKERPAAVNWTLEAWKDSLKDLELDAEIVFFGDSLTIGGRWQSYFPEQRIVNLGISGDSILGMDGRVDMIQSVSPEKVFLMGGVNSLRNGNSEEVCRQYEQLIADIKAAVPEAKLYIQSMLPLGRQWEDSHAQSAVIVEFNRNLERLASEYGAVYIDVYQYYVLDGAMNPEFSEDGIHLLPEAYRYWSQAVKEYVEE